MKYSILLLTKNEEFHVERFLKNVQHVKRLVVIDSCSTDRTVELLKKYPNVQILSRPFVSFSDQRNYGLKKYFKPGEWVLHLDADERLSKKLIRELNKLRPDQGAVAYNLASMTFFRGRAIRYASGFPVYQTRLTKAGSFEFIEVGHGQKAPLHMKNIPALHHYYEHHPFDKGLTEWIARHDRYSSLEANDWCSNQAQYRLTDVLRDPISRRQWLKQFSRWLPCAPTFIFLYLYIVKRGFLDGREGLDYCRMRAIYEHLIRLKVNDSRRKRSMR